MTRISACSIFLVGFVLSAVISMAAGQTYQLKQQYTGFYQFSSMSIVDFNGDGAFDLFYTGNGPDPEGVNLVTGGNPQGNSILVIRDASGTFPSCWLYRLPSHSVL
jgi:hypothetical protein